ncbi:MAG: ribosome small subunit-dependent GTPase A [Firmicutes bacterium]|nr:ribosome small subunit-dependent GTPase A [Bacillota bacterium]
MDKETGRIIAGIGGNYDVLCESGKVLRLKARGVFRNRKITPLLGDRVTISGDGFFDAVLERKNTSIRPAAANIDQMVVVFAVHKSEPHFKLLDRFLIECDLRKIPVLMIFTKADLLSEGEREKLVRILDAYEAAGYPYELISNQDESAREDAKNRILPKLSGKLTIFAGPSGVGKSSLISFLTDTTQEVGELSEKISRGKNTTRHARLLTFQGADGVMGLIGDTPGFSSFYMQKLDPEELAMAYPEFRPYLGSCRYSNCSHLKEEGCAVRDAVRQGQILPLRYRNFSALYQDSLNSI